ncbi:MAG: hypothetical protein ABL962_19805 [Fimbriimonadaceae bacterium]
MSNKSNNVQVEFIDLRDKFWWTMTAVLAVLAVIVLLQLRGLEPPPDPNDPAKNKLMASEVLLRNLRVTSDAANMRVAKGEWGPRRAKRKVSEAAADMVAHIKIENIQPSEAWEYGEVLWTAKQWDKAAEVLELAVKAAQSEDRRINDTLRLAQCYVALEQVDKGIALARTTFNAKPADSEPLIPSILFELVPLARNQGKNLALAKLLEDAIPIYAGTKLEAGSQRERDFQVAKPHLIKQANATAAWLRANPSLVVE